MKTCAFITFGCKVNQYDGQAMREQCQRLGLQVVSNEEPAEVYIINTCSVTEDADHEALRMIRRIRRRHATAQIVVTGCLVDRKLKALAGVDLIVPSRQKHLVAQLIADASVRAAFQPCFEGGYSELSISEFVGHTRAFVKIQDGCNYNCSFCKIPQVRGRSSSRPLEEIIAEVRRLVARGYQEIVLSGVSLGNYGREWPGGPDLADVVEALVKVEGLMRLRLSSIEPSDTTPRLLEAIASSSKVCRHLHLPLQSGSTRVLQLMRRQYTAQQYRELVASARARIPMLSLTTDLIVGFPTETDDDQAQTEALLSELKPIRTHLFSYSPRKGTWAARLKPLPPQIVRSRMDRLRSLQAALSSRYLEDLVGEELEVLIEESLPALSAPGTSGQAGTMTEGQAGCDTPTNRLVGYSDTYVKCLVVPRRASLARDDSEQGLPGQGRGPRREVEGPNTLRHRCVRVRVTQAFQDHVLASLADTRSTPPPVYPPKADHRPFRPKTGGWGRSSALRQTPSSPFPTWVAGDQEEGDQESRTSGEVPPELLVSGSPHPDGLIF